MHPIRLAISASCFLGIAALMFATEFSERGPHFQPSAAAAKADRAGTHDLAKARILTKVVGHVRSHYVDPARIDAKEMVVATLQAVQNHVAEVMVEVDRDKRGAARAVVVKVHEASQRFPLERVGDLYELSWKVMEVFEFLERRLPPTLDLEDLEYSAVNGLLSTLDPHSVLLTPQVYREMQVGTEGRFGGLGIVISLKDGVLTIMSVMPDTPAAGAALQTGDRVVRIGQESTVNMPLNDAVGRMRGRPGSDITIWIERDGWPQPRPFTITREEIQIRSVDHEALGEGIGYVHVRNFQSNTTDDLRAAIQTLSKRKGGLKGLVMDLRDNPGGLLDQAVEISDLFLSTGLIVTTVRDASRQRDERHAKHLDTLADLPLVVLINRGSASASEIVAGALKHNDRALLVGTTSFGKGSVQVVYQLDDAALKLTVRQYLTPGDISIQSVGIVPDVEIFNQRADDKLVDLWPDEFDKRGEAGLESHLDSARTRKVRPSVQLRLFDELGKGKAGKQRRRAGSADEKAASDALVALARQLLLQAPASNRKQQLVRGAALLAKRQADEQRRLVSGLQALGIDWVAGPRAPSALPTLQTTFEVRDAATGKALPAATAGRTVQLWARVENTGKRPAHRVRAVVVSAMSELDGRELVFGRIDPGASREWSATVKLPKSMNTQGDVLALDLFRDDTRVAARAATTPLPVKALAKPIFAYSVQVVETAAGAVRVDGLIQRGEELELVVAVENVGPGDAGDVLVTIKNESGEDVFIETGRAKIGALKRGAPAARARFRLKVRKGLEASQIELQLAIVDQSLRTWLGDQLVLKVHGTPEAPATATEGPVTVGPVTVVGSPAQTPAIVRAGAHRSEPTLGTLAVGSALRLTTKADEWVRVEWDAAPDPTSTSKSSPGFGWVLAAALADGTGAGVATFTPQRQHRPPEITLEDMLTTQLITGNKHATVQGVARFPQPSAQARRDVYIYRGGDKVFFRSAASVGDAAAAELPFQASIALEPGENTFTVVAREGDDDVTRQTFTIYRQ